MTNPLQLVHWPDCTNNPCTCGSGGSLHYAGTISREEFRARYAMNRHPSIDYGKVLCLDCGWQGQGSQLKAQACPVCDGRCADL